MKGAINIFCRVQSAVCVECLAHVSTNKDHMLSHAGQQTPQCGVCSQQLLVNEGGCWCGAGGDGERRDAGEALWLSGCRQSAGVQVAD